MGNLICKKSEKKEKQGEDGPKSSSLQRNLVREQYRDYHEVYNVVGIIGEGSISNIYKIMKREDVLSSSSLSRDRSNRRHQSSTILVSSTLSLPRRPSKRDKVKRHRTIKGEVYALKEIDIDYVKEGYVDELRNEVELLRELDHPHIIRLYETFYHKGKLSIVLELCTGGNLNTRNPYNEHDAADIIKQVLLAIRYMHSSKKMIVHRDIKHENIMFANETSLSIKLIDFGLSRVYHKNRLMTTRVGTLYTMSPETIDGIYNSKADLWSVGVVAFMLLSGGVKPFWGKNRGLVIRQITRAKYDFKGEVWDSRSKEGKDFVSSLLELDPGKRLDAEAALKHRWLSKGANLSRQVPSLEAMAKTEARLVQYAETGDLNRVVMNVIAKRTSVDELLELMQVFEAFDRNGDGTVSLEEFKAALSTSNLTDDEIRTIFCKMDVNRQEHIIYTEFIASLLEIREQFDEEKLADAFEVLDVDHSGKISQRDLTKVLGEQICSKTYARHLIEEADFDRDGKISFPEFKAYLTKKNDEFRSRSLNV